jgi:hypothetical protein
MSHPVKRTPLAGWRGQGQSLAVVAFLVLASLPAAAQTVPLVTFRSVHDLVLDKTVPSNDISTAAARLVTEFTGSLCKGYTDQTRFVMTTTERDGKRRTSDLRQTTMETATGHFTFDQSVYSDTRLVEQSAGVADRGPGGDIAVALRRPGVKEFSLPSAVVFPTELTRKTLAAANDGKRFLALDLYSGDAEGETVYATATIIGPKSIGADFGDDKPIGESDFATMAHWPVSVSYFTVKGGAPDPTPIYVSSYVLYDNGMISRLRIRYGDFSLVGTLNSFQKLPAAACP